MLFALTLVAPGRADVVEPAAGQPAQGQPGSPLGDPAVHGAVLGLAAEAAAAPPAPGVRSEPALLRAWSDPADSFQQRVERTRRASLEAGTWSFDAAARAALQGSGGEDPLVRAQAAVLLAPELPLAHMELARALWLQANQPMSAIRSVATALRAIASHPEASLWFAGSGLFVLAVGTCVGTLLLLVLVALRAASHAAHDLGHLTPGNAPAFARCALLCALLLVPIAAGEGVLGAAVALLAIGAVYGRPGQRVVLALAAAALWASLFPVARIASAALETFPNDSVARAAYSLTQGIASPEDLARLEAVADSDPLALRALAMDARRSGHLARADALYQRILDREPDVAALNNAANIRLALGHMESAIELYGRALDLEESPVVLFNLSQAYVRGFHVDELNRTLAAAQRVDGELVAELTALQRNQNESYVVDLPLGPRPLWQRVLASERGEALAAMLRAPLAPGLLGSSERVAGGALLAALALGVLLGGRVAGSRGCTRCGGRICAHCGERAVGSLCESCDTLFNHPEKTDRALRFARIEALRKRDRRMARAMTFASVVVPGAAGLLVDRPLRALVGAVAFCVAAAGIWWRAGVVPDPWVAGRAAPALFGGLAALALLVYVGSVLASLATRAGGEA
jgi:tetratricopeptide (TPR) repeat protein